MLSRLGESARPLSSQIVLMPHRYRQSPNLEELGAIGGDAGPRAPHTYMQIFSSEAAVELYSSSRSARAFGVALTTPLELNTTARMVSLLDRPVYL